ncbi:MAG: methyltransferase domain-containing protein [Chlorobiaceae bacterium]|nr:methyltransferase domain-containing protein [Chlorobiaceae bacterium]
MLSIFKQNNEQILLEKLSLLDDSLLKIDRQVNWRFVDTFLDRLIDALKESDNQNSGKTVTSTLTARLPVVKRLGERKQRIFRRYCVMMLKLLILQRLYELTDEGMEYEITERLSFRNFLGIQSSSKIPGSATIRRFREAMIALDLLDELFSTFNCELTQQGIFVRTGKIIEIRLTDTDVKEAGEKFSFQDSKLAHFLLDGLRGIEIGGSAHNSFHLKHCLNVDYCGDEDTIFKKAEIDLCGSAMGIDIVSEGDDLPFRDNTLDYVISSHVIEHYFDPIKAMKEWYRIIKPGGYIFTIAPHIDRVPDEHRTSVTPLDIMIERHRTGIRTEEDDTLAGGARGHHSVFNLENFLELCNHLQYNVVATEDPDKKVGNGFTVVIRK